MPAKKKTARKPAAKKAAKKATRRAKKPYVLPAGPYTFNAPWRGQPLGVLAAKRLNDSLEAGGYKKMLQDARLRAVRIKDAEKLFWMWQVMSTGWLTREKHLLREVGASGPKQYRALLDFIERKLVQMGYDS